MREVCLFAGTSEGRELAELLTAQGIRVYACVATEYGETLLEERENLTVSAGRLDQAQMEALLTEREFHCLVDATHPYAAAVTENLYAACRNTGTEYLRLLRSESELPEACIHAETTAQAVELLGSSYTIATVQPLGELGPSIPLTVTLPEPVRNAGNGLVESLSERLRTLAVQVTGVRSWD